MGCCRVVVDLHRGVVTQKSKAPFLWRWFFGGEMEKRIKSDFHVGIGGGVLFGVYNI